MLASWVYRGRDRRRSRTKLCECLTVIQSLLILKFKAFGRNYGRKALEISRTPTFDGQFGFIRGGASATNSGSKSIVIAYPTVCWIIRVATAAAARVLKLRSIAQSRRCRIAVLSTCFRPPQELRVDHDFGNSLGALSKFTPDANLS